MNIKLIRGQLRQLVKELLPDVLAEQVIESIKKELYAELRERLGTIDARQADIQSYVVRNNGVPTFKVAKSEEST